jgi:hypothetical protein
MGAPPNDWVAAFAAARKQQVAEAESGTVKASAARMALSKPSLPLAVIAGESADFAASIGPAANSGLLGEFDVAAPFQESEIPDEIEVRRAEFKAGQTDHFGKIPLTVAPIQRPDRHGRPCAGGVAFAPVRRQLIEWNCPESLAPDHNPRRFGLLLVLRRWNRFDSRWKAELGRSPLDRSLEPLQLIPAERVETFNQRLDPGPGHFAPRLRHQA